MLVIVGIKTEEVEGSMHRMSRGREIGPDEILVEFGKYAGMEGLE